MAQTYVLVQRVVTNGKTVHNEQGLPVVQNGGEFMSYLNEQYLSQGYVIHTINQVPVPPDFPVGSVQYAYHLVKEAELAPAKEKEIAGKAK